MFPVISPFSCCFFAAFFAFFLSPFRHADFFARYFIFLITIAADVCAALRCFYAFSLRHADARDDIYFRADVDFCF